MSTPTIPCKARDPRTCPYHGAEIQAEAAIKRGDFDAAFGWLKERDAAKRNTPEVVEFFEQASREQYSPSRYPYTYAADHLRTNPDLVPVEIGEEFSLEAKRQPNGQMGYIDIPSRSIASQIRQAWANQLGLTDQELAFQHAEAYMMEHGIRPEETRAQAVNRMNREREERGIQMRIIRAQAHVEERIQRWESGRDDYNYNVAGEEDQTGIDRIAYRQAAFAILNNASVDGTDPNGNPRRVINRADLHSHLDAQEHGDIEDLGYYEPGSTILTIDITREDEVNAVTAAWQNTRKAIDEAVITGANGDSIDVVQALKNLDKLYYTAG